MKRKNETTFCVTKLQVCCEFSLPVAAVADTLSFRGLDRCFHRGRLLRWSLQTWREPVSVGLRCGARRPLCLLDSSREGPRGWHDNLLLRVYQPGTLTHWLNGSRGRVREQSGQVHTQLAHFHCRLWRNIRRRGTVKGHGGDEGEGGRNWIISAISGLTEQNVWTRWDADKDLSCWVTCSSSELRLLSRVSWGTSANVR